MSLAATRGVDSPESGLRELSLQSSYRTEERDLVNEFYIPCLSQSKRYDRSAGYFDTRAFELAADGIAEMVVNGGRIRLVVSPRLRRNDVAALTGQIDSSQDWAETVLSSEFPAEELADWLRADRFGCTSWLVRNGVLEARVAFRTPVSGIPFSHYHEKIGAFTDAKGDTVAFSGSVNETGMAWTGNFESIDVFRSWQREEEARVVKKVEAFENLWRNETRGVVVKPIAEAKRDGVGLWHFWNSIKTSLVQKTGSHRNDI